MWMYSCHVHSSACFIWRPADRLSWLPFNPNVTFTVLGYCRFRGWREGVTIQSKWISGIKAREDAMTLNRCHDKCKQSECVFSSKSYEALLPQERKIIEEISLISRFSPDISEIFPRHHLRLRYFSGSKVSQLSQWVSEEISTVPQTELRLSSLQSGVENLNMSSNISHNFTNPDYYSS